MFTGIIESIGTVLAVERSGVDAQLRIAAEWPEEAPPGVKLGDSVAINGTCLTVVRFESSGGTVTMTFDASHETLRLTSLGDLSAGSKCNLERAVRPSDRLGGHLVTGHVDCTAERISVVRTGDCWDVTYGLPGAIAAEVAQKGSITIDGVSLTVNKVASGQFSVTLIPHTVASTQLLEGTGSRRVNLESDLLAKYVRRLLSVEGKLGVSLQSLADAGFSS